MLTNDKVKNWTWEAGNLVRSFRCDKTYLITEAVIVKELSTLDAAIND